MIWIIRVSISPSWLPRPTIWLPCTRLVRRCDDSDLPVLLYLFLFFSFQNNSVLENHHWRSGIGCVIESGIAAQMGDYWPTLKDQIGSLILATDITRQNEFVNKFKVNFSFFDSKSGLSAVFASFLNFIFSSASEIPVLTWRKLKTGISFFRSHSSALIYPTLADHGIWVANGVWKYAKSSSDKEIMNANWICPSRLCAIVKLHPFR